MPAPSRLLLQIVSDQLIRQVANRVEPFQGPVLTGEIELGDSGVSQMSQRDGVDSVAEQMG